MGTLEERIARTFQAFADPSGYVTFDSYTGKARLLAEVRGQDPDSPSITALTSELEGMWDFIVSTGAVKDGRIDWDDYLAFSETMYRSMQKLGPNDKWPLDQYIHRLFDAIDGDSDGRITLQEYTEWLASLGLTDDTDIIGAFASCDPNGNGTISLDEFVVCGRNFCTTDDSSAPGVRWMGP